MCVIVQRSPLYSVCIHQAIHHVAVKRLQSHVHSVVASAYIAKVAELSVSYGIHRHRHTRRYTQTQTIKPSTYYNEYTLRVVCCTRSSKRNRFVACCTRSSKRNRLVGGMLHVLACPCRMIWQRPFEWLPAAPLGTCPRLKVPHRSNITPHNLAMRMHRQTGVGYSITQLTRTYGMVWYGMVWYGMVWYGMVW